MGLLVGCKRNRAAQAALPLFDAPAKKLTDKPKEAFCGMRREGLNDEKAAYAEHYQFGAELSQFPLPKREGMQASSFAVWKGERSGHTFLYVCRSCVKAVHTR